MVAGRYELGDRLGFGGMSTVNLAFDRRLEREVAVKVLAEHLADDPQFVSRFRREALAAARLVHPNIVQVFDFGLDDGTGRHFIVMEYIRGQSGAELLREQERLSVTETLAIVNQACRGLEYAHRHGVVHRDVKPGNLLRSDDGIVKLADFGIARVGQESRITQVGSVLGTAAYLAPEQAAGEEATPVSDLYALGVVTYQLLAGRLPYDAQSLTELALRQQRERPPLLDELDPGIPHGLAQAVARALELEARHRFQSADEMREALTAGAAGQTFAEEDETAATSVLAADPTATRIASAEPPRPRRLAPTPGPPTDVPARPAHAAAPDAEADGRGGRRWAPMLLVLLLLAVVAGALYFALAGGDDGVTLRSVDHDNVSDIVDAMRGMVEDNTR
jgi:serine/threonine-protein kinase